MEHTDLTIQACNRCRKRKVRCDPGIPACSPCRKSGAVCESSDFRTKTTYPRSHISDLEDQVARLESQLQQIGERHRHGEEPGSRRTAERSSPEQYPHPAMIRSEFGGDGHFLGASSGLHLARSVLESARRNSADFGRYESLVQEAGAQNTRHGDTTTEQVIGANNTIPLPEWEKTEYLIDVFFKHYGVQYPILIQEEFVKDVRNLFSQNEGDPWTSFQLRMVLSIALHLLSHDDSDAVGLSEAFRRSAIAQLSNIMRAKNYRTLQSLLLLMLSSILSSKSAPMWYISGICMRMCVDLGYHSERTINYAGIAPMLTEELDTKRRLFWMAYTFDRSLVKMLGRPFFIDDGQIDVEFPSASLPEPLRLPVSHWLRMQRLQSELVSHLHFSKNSNELRPSTDLDMARWRTTMTEKLDAWLEAAKHLPSSDGYTMDWWEYWYHNAKLILHQPVSHGEKESILGAYEAAKNMTHLTFIRAHKGTAGFTWLDLHCQLVSCLTLLFLVLRSPDARSKAKNEWLSFKTCIVEWQVVLDKLALHWHSMVNTKEVLSKLANETLERIENDYPQNERRACLRGTGRDRNYRRSIIQGLGSPSSSLREGHDNPSLPPDVASKIDTSSLERNQGAGEEESVRAMDSRWSNERGSHPGHSQPDLNRPNQTAIFADDDLHYQNQQQSESMTPVSKNLGFSPIFGGNFSTGLEQFNTPLQLHFDSFDQSSDFNRLGMESFGLPWMTSNLGQWDTTLTDSVLNFHGFFDEGGTDM